MYQSIQSDSNIELGSHAIKTIQFALCTAETSFVLPITDSAWKYMLACLHSIKGNNYVIIDGERVDLPSPDLLLTKQDNRDFLDIYQHKVNAIMNSAKNFICFMYERNGTDGVYDWTIICPRNGKFYQVGIINGDVIKTKQYTISLSHCVMCNLQKGYRVKSALLYMLLLMKHYFNTNLRNNTDTTTTAN